MLKISKCKFYYAMNEGRFKAHEISQGEPHLLSGLEESQERGHIYAHSFSMM